MSTTSSLKRVREAFVALGADWLNNDLADAAERAVDAAKEAGCTDEEIDAAVRNLKRQR